MKHFFNYKIIFPNGKHYIGLSTTSKEQRTKEHKYCAKSGDTKYLYNALRKYNMVETFELIVIDTAETLEELCEKEKEYIIKYNSYYKNGKGYNMTYGGEGSFGYVFTDEAKLKNSEIRKKYFKDNPFAGKQHSIIMKKYYEDNANARKVMSELKKKHYEKPEVRKKHSEAQKKKYIDDPYNKKKNQTLWDKTNNLKYTKMEYL